jgi:hypothetical protein
MTNEAPHERTMNIESLEYQTRPHPPATLRVATSPHRYAKRCWRVRAGRCEQSAGFSIEPLETRVAPASVLTFTDVDGDKVKVVASSGDLNAVGVATFANVGAGQQLQLLTLSDPSIADANISTIVTKSAAGDGLVNIGRISASGVDLGKVIIKGDLGGIICGDGNAVTGPGLKLLSVRSMGIHGTATQGPSGDLLSVVEGALGALKVTGDINDASIGARNFADFADGKIGSIFVGGSVIGVSTLRGGVFSTGEMTSVIIRGDLAGSVDCGGFLASLKVGGSVLGRHDTFTGRISSSGDIGSVKIGHDIRGGAGTATGTVFSKGKINSLKVGGSVIGGSGDTNFLFGSTPVMGQITALGNIGTIKIGHDLIGASGKATGTIQSLGDIFSIVIGGSLVGGPSDESGKIDVGGKLDSLRIAGSMVGGSGNQHTFTDGDGVVHEGQVFAVDPIETVKIGRDLVGGSGIASAEIRAKAGLGFVTIAGSLIGGSGRASAQLASGAGFGGVKIGGDMVGGSDLFSGFIISAGDIVSVTIAGSLLGGSANSTGEIRAVGDISRLKIGGDLRGGSIAGTAPDLDRAGYIEADSIASVAIGGSIFAGFDDSTGGNLLHNASIRVADDIGAIKVHGSLVGNSTPNGLSRVIISARGQEALAPDTTSDIAIQSLSIRGSVQLAAILAGFDPDDTDTAGSNGNASIGAVKVGRDWIASSITAGVQDGGATGFGTAGDTVINNAGDAIIARIASILIKGVVTGSALAGDHFGFTAQQIGSFKSLGFTATLTSGSDTPIELSPVTGDVSVREV